MEYDFVIGQGDFERELRRELTDDAGNVVDLTGIVGVTLDWWPIEGGDVETRTMAVSGDPVDGTVQYQWVAGDTEVSGFRLARIKVEWEAGSFQSFPNSGYLVIYVTPSVGYGESPPLYCSVEELKSNANLQGKTYADLAILRALRAASRGIEKAAGGQRFYVPDLSNAETRYYTPTHTRYLSINYAVGIEAVSVDRDGDGVFEETWVTSTDYVPGPLNATLDGRPYDQLIARGTPSAFGLWPRDVVKAVRVEGLFGWESVPDDISLATSIVATKLLIRQRMAPLGVQAFGETLAARIASRDPQVEELLRDYVNTIPYPS